MGTLYEVPVGISLYWVRLTEERDGHHYADTEGRVSGWAAGDRKAALRAAKAALEVWERKELRHVG